MQIRIVKGQLSKVKAIGSIRLRADYFQDCLRAEADTLLNVQELQDRLQLLQQNPLIEIASGGTGTRGSVGERCVAIGSAGEPTL